MTFDLNLDEIMLSTDMELKVPRQSTVCSYQSPSISMITPSTSSYFSPSDNNASDGDGIQIEYKLIE